MSRKLLVLSLLLLAFTASASVNVTFDREKAPATINGVVDSVSGNLIRLADGLVTIDATGAKIIGEGRDGTIADVQRGMILFAQLATSDVPANAPIPARVITVTRFADATILGKVQSVDFTAKTFTLLGRTIHVTPDTRFGGRKDGSAPDLDDLRSGDIVLVQADVTGGRLVATSVVTVVPQQVTPPNDILVHISGKVAAIEGVDWTVTKKDGEPVKFITNDRTKIDKGIKVGDEVEVGAIRQGNGTLLALVILKKRW